MKWEEDDWGNEIKNTDGSFLDFEEYVDEKLLPNIQNDAATGSSISLSMSMYGQALEGWVGLFPREQLLVLSFEESQYMIQKYL
jgi:hypothetical protein